MVGLLGSSVSALTGVVKMPARDREVLQGWLPSPSIRAGLAQRARIVRLAADGVRTGEIAMQADTSKQTVISWHNPLLRRGPGWSGRSPRAEPASGHGRGADRGGDVGGAAGGAWGDALVEPAARSRAGAVPRDGHRGMEEVDSAALAVGDVTLSTDPELDAKVRDIVALHLNPPGKAVVVFVDEKTQIQALDGTDPAAAPRPAGKADPRRQPQRHDQSVRGARGRQRQGHRPLLRPAHQRRVSGLP